MEGFTPVVLRDKDLIQRVQLSTTKQSQDPSNSKMSLTEQSNLNVNPQTESKDLNAQRRGQRIIVINDRVENRLKDSQEKGE